MSGVTDPEAFLTAILEALDLDMHTVPSSQNERALEIVRRVLAAQTPAVETMRLQIQSQQAQSMHAIAKFLGVLTPAYLLSEQAQGHLTHGTVDRLREQIEQAAPTE